MSNKQSRRRGLLCSGTVEAPRGTLHECGKQPPGHHGPHLCRHNRCRFAWWDRPPRRGDHLGRCVSTETRKE